MSSWQLVAAPYYFQVNTCDGAARVGGSMRVGGGAHGMCGCVGSMSVHVRHWYGGGWSDM